MNTKRIREEFGLSQKELSEIFGIPYRTITNWDNRDCMPAYLAPMMEYILQTVQKGMERTQEGNLANYAMKAIQSHI